MRAEQVDQALRQKFITEGERLVFWQDTKREFLNYIKTGLPEDLHAVTILDLDEDNGFSAKIQLESKDLSGKYLLYSTHKSLPPEEDWLLDIRLYSTEFHADMASLWLEALGLATLSLREHLSSRGKFLANQTHREKLKQFIVPDDNQAAIDLKMIAVLVGSDIANLSSILISLCQEHLCQGIFNLDQEPYSISQMHQMGLFESFWLNVKKEFCYEPENPTISGLLRCLFVSDLFHQLNGATFHELAHFELPPHGRQNAMICLAQWRDSSAKAQSYEAISEALAFDFKIKELHFPFPTEFLMGTFTFWEIELKTLSYLASKVLEEAQSIDLDTVVTMVTKRKSGHWLCGPGREQPKRKAVSDAYDAIVAAAELFSLRIKYQSGFSFTSPEELLSAYQNELYQFDQLYRHFFTKAKSAQEQNWDVLKSLAEEVERAYEESFLQPLGLEWSRHLQDGGFLQTWRLPSFAPQQNFYSQHVLPHVNSDGRKRAFIIISDAFRYEAAQELMRRLNSTYRMNAKLESMLGVLPSHTKLGMASLLPHNIISFDDKGDVLVDGISTSSTKTRNEVLENVEGVACLAKDLHAMKKKEAREYIKGKRIIYIYHNMIDARGDHKATEDGTFQAVNDCIKDLIKLVAFCSNNLSASKVWITADHGFLFQEAEPKETFKSKLSFKPSHTIVEKKRYILGRNLGSAPEAHHGFTSITANTKDVMDFWIPKGINRFHFAGGARFIHGGAMPQEIMIPLLTVNRLRGEKAANSRVAKVAIQILGGRHKITTPKYRFELIQTEAVGERRKPITLRAAVYDGTQPVTSIDTVTLDSKSDSLEERKKSIRVELRSGEFDKVKPYRLVLRDAETDTEVQSLDVIIDRSFDDDF